MEHKQNIYKFPKINCIENKEKLDSSRLEEIISGFKKEHDCVMIQGASVFLHFKGKKEYICTTREYDLYKQLKLENKKPKLSDEEYEAHKSYIKNRNL